MTVTCRIDAGDVMKTCGCFEHSFNDFWIAVFKRHDFTLNVHPLFRRMPSIHQKSVESVVEHPVFIVCIHEPVYGVGDFFRFNTHERETRQTVCEVAIVGESAPKLSVFHLPLIDPPHIQLFQKLEILDLTECPERYSLGSFRLCKCWPPMGRIFKAPVIPALFMVGIDTEQVEHIPAEPVKALHFFQIGVTFTVISEIINGLNEPVLFVFRQGFFAILENETNPGAIER